MRATVQLSITLPGEMADLIKEKVAAGEYANESEVVGEGIRALRARELAVENWLASHVVPACQALEADPARALTGEQVRAQLASEFKKLAP